MLTFGDNVKVLSTPETIALGIAGKFAHVYGETIPPETGVVPIGEPGQDYAINICIHDTEEQFWVYPHLVEFIDHGEGAELIIGKYRAVRRADASWDETTVKPGKRWWEFWK